MPVIPVVHSDVAIRETIRRGMRNRRVRVVGCRSLERVEQLLDEALVDAIVLDVRRESAERARRISERYPGIPIFAFSAFRPDDGVLLSVCARVGFHILVVGVDEPVANEYITAHSAGMWWRRQLQDAPELLRLSEPMQRRAWDEVLAMVDTPARTGGVAHSLGVSREHLSREFAAGGAPNLKRVIDLARLACAAQLLTNPGYSVERVAGILKYSSPSHLAESARRIAGVRPSMLGAVGPRGVLFRFQQGRTRSRF